MNAGILKMINAMKTRFESIPAAKRAEAICHWGPFLAEAEYVLCGFAFDRTVFGRVGA